jgi:uncharacterized protein YjbI with pentapeptide repeats
MKTTRYDLGKRWFCLVLAMVLGLALGCGGSSSNGDGHVLDDGSTDPRAYTEGFRRENPRAALRLSHLAIVDLEPAGDIDRIIYYIDQPRALMLAIDPSADQVGALSLRDARELELLHLEGGAMPVQVGRGRHTLEIHHAAAGDPQAPRQLVFVRSGEPAAGAVLEATANCPGCSFDRSMLGTQDFDGINLNGATFRAALITNSTFRGAQMVDCDLRGEVFNTLIRSSDFCGANLSGARFDFATVSGGTMFGGPPPTVPANLSNTTWSAVQLSNGQYEPGLLTGVIFDNANLTGAEFGGVLIAEASFNGANLSGADFTALGTTVLGQPLQTECEMCDFSVEPGSGTPTNLSGAIFTKAGANQLALNAGISFLGANLTGAQLENGNFQNLIFSQASFDQAKLGGTQFNGSAFNGAMFRGTDLTGVLLEGVNLRATDLSGATLSSASLVGSNLDYSNLRNADLAGAMLGAASGDSMQPASLIGAYMPNVDLSNADLRNVDLSGAHLYGDSTMTLLDGALLDGANLSDAICSGAEFTGASLAGAVLDGAQLVNCTFDQANLSDASFDTAYLQGADFSGAANIRGLRFSNAAVSQMPGAWTFTEQNGAPVTYQYGATTLGGLATDASVICPNGDNGPCVGGKLTPVSNGPFPPIPHCVPLPPDYNNCTAPTPP